MSGCFKSILLFNSSIFLINESALVYQQVREHIDESHDLKLVLMYDWLHGLRRLIILCLQGRPLWMTRGVVFGSSRLNNAASMDENTGFTIFFSSS